MMNYDTTNYRFSDRRTVEVMLPTAAARRLCVEAARAWGPRAVDHHAGGRETTIPIWHAREIGSPFGSCRVRWEQPTPATAVVTEVAWNEAHGGSYGTVASAVNALAGWPILR